MGRPVETSKEQKKASPNGARSRFRYRPEDLVVVVIIGRRRQRAAVMFLGHQRP